MRVVRPKKKIAGSRKGSTIKRRKPAKAAVKPAKVKRAIPRKPVRKASKKRHEKQKALAKAKARKHVKSKALGRRVLPHSLRRVQLVRRVSRAKPTKPVKQVSVAFARGPVYVALRRKLKREPTPKEFRAATVPTTRDRAIISVWDSISARGREALGQELTPAGYLALRKTLLKRGKDEARAAFLARRAYENGTLERDLQRIAIETGLTPREVYSLGVSPPSMGMAA